MKKLLIVLSFLIFSNNVYADSKFEKDLKKVSKDNGFVDSEGTIYPIEQISNKENTILIIYTHGSHFDWFIDKCSEPWNKPPPVIRQLHDQKIKKFQIKIYHLCSGVRGWTEKERSKMWEAHQKSGKLSSDVTDKKNVPLMQKRKQVLKQKVIKEKIDSFAKQGFENIVLAGHSSGGWQSIKIKAKFPELVKGVIGLQPGAGGTVKNRKDWPWWEDVRYYGFVEDLSQLNAIIVTHDKDHYNSPKDYSLFSNLNSVKFVNLTESGCKKAEPAKNYHSITLTKCYADYEMKNKDIVRYLEQIF